MADDKLLILISAYADGELDAASAAALESELTQHPHLAEALAACKALDHAAQTIPVPNIEQKLSVRWSIIRERTVMIAHPHTRRIEAAAAEIPAPQIPAARFDRAWQQISSRTVTPTPADIEGIQRSALHDGETAAKPRETNAVDAQQWEKLDRATAGMRVPQIPETASVALWQSIAAATVAQSASDRAAWSKLEAAAAHIPVPQIDAKKFEQAWTGVDARTHHDASGSVPAVNDERWNSVWRGIQARTMQKPQIPSQQKPSATVVRADFKPRHGIWKWAATAAIAAVMIFSVLLLPAKKSDDGQISASMLEVPEVLDDRYNVQVKYLEGDSHPWVCIFLNDAGDETEVTELSNWHWLPD
jgi:hypothetical protein